MDVVTPVSFEVWGDSHMDDMAGIGARNALRYATNFRHDVEILRNKAKAGSVVKDWIEEYATQDKADFADVLVVSSGFNEAVLIAWGMSTLDKTRDYWKFLIGIAKANGQKVLWVPTNSSFGRAVEEFKATRLLQVMPSTLGADCLTWTPLSEADLCPDRIHNSYVESFRLTNLILDRVSSYQTVIGAGENPNKPTNIDSTEGTK